MMLRRASITILCVLAIAPLVLFAYVSPGKPTGFVNDFAELLPQDAKTNLENKLSTFADQTGNEIAVVTIQNLGGDTIENYAQALFREWGIGDEEKDTGALLLVSRDDREMRIEVGYGLEGSLTDSLSGRIIRNTLAPAFGEGDFAGGIDRATDQMISIVGGEIPTEIQTENEGSGIADILSSLWIFILIFLTWIPSIFARSKSWWAGGVAGGIIGVVVGFIFGFVLTGIITIALLVPLGLLFDFLVSRAYTRSKGSGIRPPWWAGGGGMGGHGGGGFGGFGGGMSGGGGASGRW